MRSARTLLPTPSGPCFRRCFEAVVLLYPGALLLGFLSTWLAARVSLGHWPRPSLDDPKDIGLLVDIPHCATIVLLVVGFPLFVFALAGLILFAMSDPGKRGQLMASSGIGLTGMILSVFVLRSDPFAIVGWFLD